MAGSQCSAGGIGQRQRLPRSLRLLAGWCHPLVRGFLGREWHEMMPVWYRGEKLDMQRGLLKSVAAERWFSYDTMNSDMLKGMRRGVLTEEFEWPHELILGRSSYTVRASHSVLSVVLLMGMSPTRANAACLRSRHPTAALAYSPETKAGHVHDRWENLNICEMRVVGQTHEKLMALSTTAVFCSPASCTRSPRDT